MGQRRQATCAHCNYGLFWVSDGGGFSFHLLHCDTCGKEKSISFDQIGEVHLRYLKGLSGPYCIPSSAYDKRVRETYQGEPLTEEEYHKVVEFLPKKCRCGGHFTFSSPPRCPKCHSSDLIITDDMDCNYD